MLDWLIGALACGSLACFYASCRRDLARWARLAASLGGLFLLALLLVGFGRQTLTQQILNGILLGSIYALIALGYTMVYGVLKMINFAHGEVFMVGAYIGCMTLTAYRTTPALAVFMALLAAMVGCAVLGVLIERAAYRPLREAPRLAALITAIGVSLLLQNVVLLLVGATPKTVPGVLPTHSIGAIRDFCGLLVNLPSLVALAGSVGLMLVLQLIVARTRLGRAMRAVSEDREAAQLMGIHIDLVIAMTFVIGSALAGAGGVLYGMKYPSISPYAGVLPGLKAFVAAVLGGIGSLPGAMAGGMLIGVIETLVSATAATSYQVGVWTVFLALLVIAGRPLQAQLHQLPRTTRGRALQAAAGVALVAAGYLLARGIVTALVPLLPGLAPHESAVTISGSTFKDAVAFAVLIVILIVKPTGLMGRFAPEKV